jgi:hypothetical protein
MSHVQRPVWNVAFHFIFYMKKYFSFVAFQVLTEVVMNIAIFWDIAPCSPYMNRLSEERITSIFRVENQPRNWATPLPLTLWALCNFYPE